DRSLLDEHPLAPLCRGIDVVEVPDRRAAGELQPGLVGEAQHGEAAGAGAEDAFAVEQILAGRRDLPARAGGDVDLTFHAIHACRRDRRGRRRADRRLFHDDPGYFLERAALPLVRLPELRLRRFAVGLDGPQRLLGPPPGFELLLPLALLRRLALLPAKVEKPFFDEPPI